MRSYETNLGLTWTVHILRRQQPMELKYRPDSEVRVERTWSAIHGRETKHPPEDMCSEHPCASSLLGLGDSRVPDGAGRVVTAFRHQECARTLPHHLCWKTTQPVPQCSPVLVWRENEHPHHVVVRSIDYYVGLLLPAVQAQNWTTELPLNFSTDAALLQTSQSIIMSWDAAGGAILHQDPGRNLTGQSTPDSNQTSFGAAGGSCRAGRLPCTVHTHTSWLHKQ